MSGLKLVVPTTFTDATLPILRDDPVLTAGSLILLDPAHPARPLAAGVPASGGLIPNLAWVEAAATIGGNPAQATLDHPFLWSATANNGVKGKLERSTKGGLHGIVSQAVALASGDGAWVTLPAAMRAYLIANQAHRYYMSMWDRLTRINGGVLNTTGANEAGVIGTSTAASLTAFTPKFGPVTAPGTPSTFVRTDPVSPAINTLGNRYVSVATINNNTMGGAAVTYLGGHLWGAPTNSIGASVLAACNTFWPSMLMYRFYLEDLTVSGRSYAAVDALDYAEYTKQVLTGGGRYYGDTFTAPATIV